MALLHLLGAVPVRDVGEDPSLRGLVDESAILHVEDRDHRTRGLVDDLIDQLERLRGALVNDHDRHVGVLGRRMLAISGRDDSRAITSCPMLATVWVTSSKRIPGPSATRSAVEGRSRGASGEASYAAR
jgi:hypothetical protein